MRGFFLEQVGGSVVQGSVRPTTVRRERTDRGGCRCTGKGTTPIKEVVVSCDVGWNQSVFDGTERTFRRDRMTFPELLQLADSGTTAAFAVLVWFELRKVREEVVSVLHRIDGFIQAKED